MPECADKKQPSASQSESEHSDLSLDLGGDVDARAQEYKLQQVRAFFKDYGSVPSFHQFKDLAHLRASLTRTNPIDREIRKHLDPIIRERMVRKLEGTDGDR